MNSHRALVTFSLVFGWMLIWGCSAEKDVPAPASYRLSVFQLNDQHSHWLGLPNGNYQPETTGDGTTGGAARWVPLVEAEKAVNPDTLLLAAGDFTMGTLLVGAQNSAGDLNTLKAVGFDAIGLGNHEFDWGPEALARMIKASEKPRVPLVLANIKFSAKDARDDALEALYGKPGESGKAIFPYAIVKTPSHVKVGVFGLMGLNAASVSNAAPVTFSKDMEEMASTAQEIVDALRNKEKVDVVLCLAHLGIEHEAGRAGGETVELARRVEGIDIILSGHNHTVMEKPLEVACQRPGSSWNTVTMEAGSYGRLLGRYELVQEDAARTITGETLPVVDSLPGSAKVTQLVNKLVTDVEKNVLSKFDRLPTPGAFLDGTFFQELTPASFDLPYRDLEASSLAYLVADALRESTGADFSAVSNAADVRENLFRTKQGTFDLADAFMVSPLGIGPDGLLGYPMIKAYLSLYELWTILEYSTCDLGLKSNEYFVVPSGLKVIFDPRRPKMGRVVKLVQYKSLDESDAGTVLLENGVFKVPSGTLYSIGLSSYTAQFVSTVGIRIKDAAGNAVDDLLTLIVRDDQGREMKEWYAVARKLATLGQKGLNQYNDDSAENPVGPRHRRIWNVAVNPLP